MSRWTRGCEQADTGAKYPDKQSKFFESVPSDLLLTITKDKMIVELKRLDGTVLDRKEFAATSAS